MEFFERKNETNDIFTSIVNKIKGDSQHSGSLFKHAVLFVTSKNGPLFHMNTFGETNERIENAAFHARKHPSSFTTPKVYKEWIICCQEVWLDLSSKGPTGYLGLVIPEESMTVKDAVAFVRNCAMEFNRKKEPFQLILTVDNVIEKANFNLSFHQLVHALIHCITECQKDLTVVFFEQSDDYYVPIASSVQQIVNESSSFSIHHEQLHPSVSEASYTIDNNLFHEYGSWQHLIKLSGDYGLIGMFSMKEPSLFLEPMTTFLKMLEPLLVQGYEKEQTVMNSKRSDLLLHVTKKFHSSMDIGEVLGEVLFAINEMFPAFEVHLYLSREWAVDEALPIKPLRYGSNGGNPTAEHAYLTGQTQINNHQTNQRAALYVPLRGKQGVYGIMQVETKSAIVFPKREIEFIEMLADTGGSALENAELYQQSRKLIHDLQLINETSQQLNSNLRLADTVTFMSKQMKQAFGAEEVGFLLFQNGELTVLEGSTPLFQKEVTKQKLSMFVNEIQKNKDAVYIGDSEQHEEIRFGPYRSILALPMVQSEELKGLVLVVHHEPYHFTFEDFKLIQSLIHHSTLAFMNSMLHEELEKMVITDYLTRLYSRNYLDEKIQESIAKDPQGAFILLDIDNFKEINDSFGHKVGDDIIIQVATIIQQSIRDEDIAARWGGEELAVYLPKVEEVIGYKIAQRIVKAVAMKTNPNVTVSCGLSVWHQRDEEISSQRLFEQADKRLYFAKESGKNRVVAESYTPYES
ncbi:sensor domain-containing diguanylate cyclase [Halalkalibacterium ligniniphilum]|uniref:sensor domain-containing diguanylate cyclase n=1 Tax=Halalkalibacterium ligniniphilum TaxID=1134413 RepID=UPI00034C3C69|nr:sensor domain-containing diguanylate cyclase [Halalkalibacterium ligniniphilum]